jgi:hypothetical protein
MKGKNIPRHTIKHMWLAFVKKAMIDNPTYKVFRRAGAIVMLYERVDGSRREIINYELFRGICERFLDKGRQAVIAGEALHIPSMGYIYGKRIERDFRSKKKNVDWKRTTAAGYTIVNGKRRYNKVFYNLQDEYCRIGWLKPNITVSGNIEYYSFEPTNSGSKTHCENPVQGFKEEFSHAIQKDPTLKYKFVYCPIRDYVVIDTFQPQ